MFENAAFILPALALVFGILILILPKALNYLVAIYLIVVGILGLWPFVTGTPIPLP